MYVHGLRRQIDVKKNGKKANNCSFFCDVRLVKIGKIFVTHQMIKAIRVAATGRFGDQDTVKHPSWSTACLPASNVVCDGYTATEQRCRFIMVQDN